MKNFFLSLFITSSCVFAQKAAILEIELTNESLISGIEHFINDTKGSNPKFTQMGYVDVRILYYDRLAKESDIKHSYRIKDQYVSLDDQRYPPYYTCVNGKLVLLFIELDMFDDAHLFTEKSKAALDNKLKPFLNKIERIIAKDKDGNVVIDDPNFRDETYNLHGGILLNIFGDGSYEIKANK
ncbi:hypothetical protein AB9K26_14000 [Psychroserpens sp. XS_ASV72]|uniref:hypothetical protein n=1 Tax=Psychroserpens sp. XS_ASV72 TaxID=3241293 RepID=UPI003511BA47